MPKHTSETEKSNLHKQAAQLRLLHELSAQLQTAMYSDEFIKVRAGWCHSTPRQAVDRAGEAGWARLILFHHEPEHDDDMVDRLLADARGYAREVAPKLTVEAAVEGDGFTL